MLQHAGLVATLQRHCAEIAQHQPIDVIFDAADGLEPLEPDVALCLFRVTQEALANAVRHAHARTVRVRLHAGPDHITMTVTDDGVGFDTHRRPAAGLGLRSIDERVRFANGRLAIESHPGLGTTLKVLIPAGASPRESRH